MLVTLRVRRHVQLEHNFGYTLRLYSQTIAQIVGLTRIRAAEKRRAAFDAQNARLVSAVIFEAFDKLVGRVGRHRLAEHFVVKGPPQIRGGHRVQRTVQVDALTCADAQRVRREHGTRQIEGRVEVRVVQLQQRLVLLAAHACTRRVVGRGWLTIVAYGLNGPVHYREGIVVFRVVLLLRVVLFARVLVFVLIGSVV